MKAADGAFRAAKEQTGCKKMLKRFHAGAGVKKDIDNMQYLAKNMLGRTFCPLGDAAAMPIIAFVKKFRQGV